MESKPAAEFDQDEIAQGRDEADTHIKAEVLETVDPAETNASVEKPQHVFSTKCASDHTKPVPHHRSLYVQTSNPS